MNISTRWVISFLKQMRQPMGPAAVCLTALCFCGGCAPSGEEEPPRQASYLTDQFGVISPGDTKDYMEIIDLEGNVIYSPAREKTEPAQTPEIEGAAAVPNEAAGPAAVDEAPVEAEPVLATPVHEPEAEVLAPVWEVVAEPSLVEPAAQQEMESEGDVTDSGPRKEVEQQDEEPEQTAPKIGAEPPAQSGVRDASLHSEWPQERDFESTAITLNPSFEDWDGLQATGWETVERDGKMWTPSTGVGHTGDVAMAISGRASEERLFVALRSTSIAVRPGDVVDFELWARSEGASKEGLTAFVQALIGEEWKTLRGRVKAIAAPEWTLQTA
ncbi:MAG: hypothetical protein KJ052_09520 [Candidatus Hydrogenedentes bacterium]|nr:hypothetical protein [Candidatus Hydrogenedentota bacterium]